MFLIIFYKLYYTKKRFTLRGSFIPVFLFLYVSVSQILLIKLWLTVSGVKSAFQLQQLHMYYLQTITSCFFEANMDESLAIKSPLNVYVKNSGQPAFKMWYLFQCQCIPTQVMRGIRNYLGGWSNDIHTGNYLGLTLLI